MILKVPISIILKRANILHPTRAKIKECIMGEIRESIYSSSNRINVWETERSLRLANVNLLINSLLILTGDDLYK